MPDPITGLIVGGTALAGGAIQSSAAGKAGKAQSDAAMAGVAEQRAAREQMYKLLQPWIAGGGKGLEEQLALLGLGPEGSQAAAINEQAQNPLFLALAKQGEDAILANASATGGLRGGDVHGALAEFRPRLLNDFITQQYERLAGLSRMGQNSAAGVGAAGMESASNIAQLLGEAGAAKAGAYLGKGQAWGNVLSLPAQFAGMKFAGAF